MTREVALDYDGPTINCPRCSTRIAIETPSGWSIRSPQDVFDHLGAAMGALEREELRVLLLNAKNIVLRTVTVYNA